MTLEGLLSRWGLVAVFWGCFFEGETAAILGGVITHHGLSHWALTALAAFAGAFLADQIWFLLSRHMPREGRIGSWLSRMADRTKANWLHQWLSRHPDGLTLAFRFVPGTRIVGPVLLAQTAMGWRRFTALNALSCAIWAMLFTALGYHFGRAVYLMLGRLHGMHLGMMLIMIAGVGLALHLILRRKARRRSARQAADQA
ncbi:VTT domain-containing protein [Pseudomonas sp. GX19020]|uniref:DedA family protein n=1 Tax=Pseudomonas sp. GX19020 TaxID=2942277 RepID=UPI002019CE77|nr:VTT domain-containing protein [Pseudomonas sp. GX19020]MCL4065163.1 VTT domain-containing protein [Pseudomonas sp. GX19020]